jgi:hypothetical protein
MKQAFLPFGVRGLLATPSGFLAAVARATYAYGISGRNIVGGARIQLRWDFLPNAQ